MLGYNENKFSFYSLLAIINNNMEQLSEQKCVPCEGGVLPLKEIAAKKYMEGLSSWEFNEKEIRKSFEFKNFKHAMEFVNQVAGIAEKEGHHPDISISYNKVELALSTHAIGELSKNDFIVAAKVDGLEEK